MNYDCEDCLGAGREHGCYCMYMGCPAPGIAPVTPKDEIPDGPCRHCGNELAPHQQVRELMRTLQALNHEHLIGADLETLEMIESMLHEQERRVRNERRARLIRPL